MIVGVILVALCIGGFAKLGEHATADSFAENAIWHTFYQTKLAENPNEALYVAKVAEYDLSQQSLASEIAIAHTVANVSFAVAAIFVLIPVIWFVGHMVADVVREKLYDLRVKRSMKLPKP